MATETSYSVFDEFLTPLVDVLTPEIAEKILAARISPQYQAHIDELAAKASVGSLSEEERAEYGQIVEAQDLLMIVKAKIRTVIGRR